MNWFLVAIIWASGGGSAYYEKEWPMPDFETCIEAVQNSETTIDVEAGGKRKLEAGISLFCAQKDTPDDQ